ncbi:hypothetical protein L21SP4_00341 [Kiritimatiella glycovorans]|uniref:Septum formation initiator n=2 Tax=Kiritimatiella glycovorans TaxID=1307763 RepID=A0A0G3EDY1_9BACT|nr:hypothetical protein L21SP4_00341 [Kiritimatiella glycovorans]
MWNMLYRLAWIFVGVLVLGSAGFAFYPKLQQYQRYQEKRAEMERRIEVREDQIRELRNRREHFLNDPEYAERIAHEMGLARPEETLFRFIDEPPVATNETDEN